MHSISALLEENGLVGPEAIYDRIFRRWDVPTVEKFLDRLYQEASLSDARVREGSAENAALESFTFVASSSVMGQGGCSEAGCRSGRAELLARYAALYTDKVVVPVELVDPHRSERPKTPAAEFELRNWTLGTVLCLHAMRPVIDAGLVAIVPPELHFCRDCAAHALRKIRRVSRAANNLALANMQRFSVTYNAKLPVPVFTVHGPSEFCEHGRFAVAFFETPAWLPKSCASKGEVLLSSATLKRSKLVHGLFERIGLQVAIQQFLNGRYKAKTITTHPGELTLLSTLDPSTGRFNRAATSLARLTHSIPLMGAIPLARAVRIRREENAAFLVYRKALTDTVSRLIDGQRVLTESQAAEVVAEVLEPELAKLRQIEEGEKRRARRKAGMRMAFAATLLTLGLFKGLQPLEYAALGAAAGLADTVGDIARGSGSAESKDLYFLLRLTQ